MDATAGSAMDGGEIGIQEGQLVIVTKEHRIETVELKNQILRDIVSKVHTNYSDQLTVSTPYPLYSTIILKETEPQQVTVTSPVVVLAASDIPEVALSFGLVMAPSGATSSAKQRSLLSKAGFQLDVLDTLQFYAPKKNEKKPAFYAQARLGLHTSQEVSVTGNATGDAAVAPQVETVLAQAD